MARALRFARRRLVARSISSQSGSDVKTYTSYLTFNTKKRQEIIDITDEVEKCRAAAGISEGFLLVSAMHISASVFVNDHEPGLWKDILDWLENRIAPWDPDEYRHNSGTGEDNAAAHLRSLTVGHEVIVPVTKGKLDFGPWQRVFYGEWDGQRSKRVLIKAMGE
jgi:secondary thiamine-phosphate synthase enzyme